MHLRALQALPDIFGKIYCHKKTNHKSTLLDDAVSVQPG
jgi:hypothetical protein